MRTATLIANWVIGSVWLLLILATLVAKTGASAVSLIGVVPFVTMLAVLHAPSLLWLRWPALIANLLWVAIGVFVLAATSLRTYEAQYVAVAVRSWVIPFALIVCIFPGTLNLITLWRRLK
jgi:hypothetical protein